MNTVTLLVILFIILISLIISIYQRTNKQFREQRDQLKELLDVFDENIIMSETDLQGRITYASKAFAEISGFNREELIGKPHRIVRHEYMPKEAFKDLWETIQSGKTWSGEVKNRRKDGSDYWVKSSVSPKLKNGKIVGYTSIRSDITSQKIAEELAKANVDKQKFLDLLIDSLEQIVVVTNGLKINQVNKKFLEFFEIKSLEEFSEHGFNCICDTFEGDAKHYIQKKN